MSSSSEVPPDALRARDIDSRHLSGIVAINNEWQIRDDWSHLVHAGDFPTGLSSAKPGQEIHSAESYVPANNLYGGIIYAGATMAFTTSYWALEALRPDVMAFFGCDMIYSATGGRTHFYGNGNPDPLRPDPTLQNLEAKANRLMIMAARQGCLCANLSVQKTTRLIFPRLSASALCSSISQDLQGRLTSLRSLLDPHAISAARASEDELNCFVGTGDYWRHFDTIDAGALSAIDKLWLAAVPCNVS